jgi:hypothetical protein
MDIESAQQKLIQISTMYIAYIPILNAYAQVLALISPMYCGVSGVVEGSKCENHIFRRRSKGLDKQNSGCFW